MLRPFVAVLLLAGCSRRPTSDAAPRSTVVPTAGLDASAVAPVPEAAAAEAAPPAEETVTLTVPGGPAIVLHAVGQVIEVTLPGGKAAKPVEVERHLGDAVQRETITRSSLHSAKPGAAYVYRARTKGGAWSSEVTLHVGVAGGPPPAPRELVLRPESAFAVRLAWTAPPGSAGVEIQRRKNADFVRVALVNPVEHEFVHHLRVPGEAIDYRVRAFNAKGASAWVTASTTTPTETDPKAPPMGPCIPPVTKAPRVTSCNGDTSVITGPGEPVSNVPGAGDGCRRHLIAKYAGCTRELGVFEVQADILAVEGHADEGYPLLHAIMGAGEYTGAQLDTLQFRHGRYVVADEALFCGEDRAEPEDPALGTTSDDVASCQPPFQTCQRDAPL